MSVSHRSASLEERVSEIRLVRELDMSDTRPAWLAVASNGAHVRLSPEGFLLINAVKGGVSAEDLAGALNARVSQPRVSADELRVATVRAVEHLEHLASGVPGAPGGFWATRPLIPATLVAWVVKRIAWLYRWPAVTVVVAAVAGALATAPAGWFSLAASDGALAAGYGLFVSSLLVHEFGHAAACWRFGLAPGAVGFTMYLLFPALYTDVTRAWGLSRRQRVVIDLGGNYFQAVVGTAYLALFGVTGWQAFGVATSLVALSMLFSLNPVFKCDGYWVVADALGVTNLSDKPRVLVQELVRWLRNGVRCTCPWPKPVVAVLVGYSGLTVGVWLWFIIQLTPMLAARFSNLDTQFARVVGAIHNQGVGFWAACFGLAASLFLLTGSAVMIVRLGRAIAPAFLKSRE